MNIQRQYCLIVDDDEDDQEMLQMCLKKLNCNVDCSTANNGAEAIDLLASDKQYTPDYIFLDLNMPKMNGMDCLRALKKIRRLKDTKILMYSTTSEWHAINESKKLGADDFIVKPAKSSELEKKLYNIFGDVCEADEKPDT